MAGDNEGEKYYDQLLSFISSASVRCAIQLGIPDVIHSHGKPMTLSDLVAALQIKPDKAHGLQRLLRVLIEADFITQSKPDGNHQNEEERYFLTPASQLLLKDEEYNSRALEMQPSNPALIKPWYVLSNWFRNDNTNAFNTAHGEEFYEMCSKTPVIKDSFNELMESDSTLVANIMIRECKDVFDGLTSLVDVGGGTGTVAKVILQTFPNLKCTVVDLPHVVGDLQGSVNLNFVVGDMFHTIPPANAVLLKFVMHNWGDEECIKILKRCKEAIPSKDEGGKVIIIDMVMGNQRARGEQCDETGYKVKISFDLLMMAYHGGKERNEQEWEQLFTSAGFSHYKIVTNKLGSRSLIEVYP